jgi:ADP-heptose:LPS heptosyltransferase
MKILFFRLGAVGDCLLTTPAVRYLKELYPAAQVHYLAGSAAAPILENNPYIDRLMSLRLKKHFLPREFGIFFIIKELREHFKGESYDYFIDFESSYFSAYISLFIKAGEKIGHKIRKKSRWLYNLFYRKRLDFDDTGLYSPLRQLALVKLVNDKGRVDTNLVLSLTDAEKEKAASFYSSLSLAGDAKKILFGVSGTWPSKSWPKEHWKRLAARVLENHPSARCVILWGPGDDLNFLNELSVLKNVSIMPKGGLRDLAGIISMGDLLISNDSAARHIADALRVKTIGLFGPTDPLVWAKSASAENVTLTPGVGCSPCDKTECDRGGCMDKITPDMVAERIKKML